MSKGESSSKIVSLIDEDEIKLVTDPFGHSWKCSSENCLYNFCVEIKKLIANTSSCKHSILTNHTCQICKELMYFLQQHRDNCSEIECEIPNCRNNVKQLTILSEKIQSVVGRCGICAHDVKTGQDWYCKYCSDFNVCDSCYKKEGLFHHPHKLITQNEKARKDAEQKVSYILEVLAHCFKCKSSQCHPSCRKMIALFHHGKLCQVRASGGCLPCNKMWRILQFHAESCKETECSFSRCQELKEHLRKYYQLC